MHSRKTGSTITSYIAHFLSEINEAEVAGKWQFYCVNTSYPMDTCYSGRCGPARQTSEKDVPCFHWLAGP